MPAAVGRDVPFRVELHVSTVAPRRRWRQSFATQVPAAALPAFQVHAFRLPAGGSLSLAATFRIPVRGSFEFGPAWLRLTGPFDVLDGAAGFFVPRDA